VIFCDTSTLAKYYLNEPESVAVRARLEDEDQVVLSELAQVELMGAFHRRLREHKWTRHDFASLFVNSPGMTSVVSVLGRAGTGTSSRKPLRPTHPPENVFVRASDCLHLVTALHHGFRDVTRTMCTSSSRSSVRLDRPFHWVR